MLLFGSLYILILPLSLIIASGVGYLSIGLISSFPEAANFEWKWNALLTSYGLLGLLILAGFY